MLSAELSEQLFSVSEEIRLLAFTMGDQKIEVFICPDYRPPYPDIPHSGLLVDNFTQVLEKAEKNGVTVIKGSHTGKTVYFVKDFSGNMIEIKQSA